MRGDLEQAYKTAVRDYTRKGADGEAQKAEAEWKEFRNAPIIAATKRKLLGTWSLRVDNGYTSDLVFHEDGTVDHTMSGGTMPWKIDLDAGFVFLGNDKKGDKIQLPLNEDKGTGTNGGGQQFTVTKKK